MCLTLSIWARSRWIKPPVGRYWCIRPGGKVGLVGF
jgi:hypothetical protein